MWQMFVDGQTKQVFVNMIELHRQFYTNRFEEYIDLEERITALEKQHRRLSMPGRVVGDSEYVDIIFDHTIVVFTEFARQNKARYLQPELPRPTPAQALNDLRIENETRLRARREAAVKPSNGASTSWRIRSVRATRARLSRAWAERQNDALRRMLRVPQEWSPETQLPEAKRLDPPRRRECRHDEPKLQAMATRRSVHRDGLLEQRRRLNDAHFGHGQ